MVKAGYFFVMRNIFCVLRTTLVLAAICAANPVTATTLLFDGSWKEQGFFLFSSNDYIQNGRSLSVSSDGTVSILYRRVPSDAWGAQIAQWDWGISSNVPATDLTRKGGDDRNLAIYFVFASQKTAQSLNKRSLRRLLRSPDIRVLVYVWGGDHAVRDILPSPYLDARGKTVIQRISGPGRFTEQINLDADLQAAFGERPNALIGIAISADSDDTDSRIEGLISDIKIEPIPQRPSAPPDQ